MTTSEINRYCLRETLNFTNTVITNICTGEIHIIPSGNLSVAGYFFTLSLFVILFLTIALLVINFYKDHN